jgi:methionyl-tRNA formyltransferase
MINKNVYFLGYSKKKTKLISFLKKKNCKVTILHNRDLTLKNALAADMIISFGYRKIIGKKILKAVKRPIINLHMSYLPYNRGSHPNFWSFVENTKKGVTIHEINNTIDGGRIIFRKKIRFKGLAKLKTYTFYHTYKILFNEMENLFIKNFNKILKGNYKIITPEIKGSYHKKKDLPKNFKSWKININTYLKKI